MVSIWVASIGIVAAGVAAHFLGHRSCNKEWEGEMGERVNQLLDEKVNEVRDMYDSMYKDIVYHLAEIIKEEITKSDSQ